MLRACGLVDNLEFFQKDMGFAMSLWELQELYMDLRNAALLRRLAQITASCWAFFCFLFYLLGAFH